MRSKPTFVGNQQARSKNGSAPASAMILRKKGGEITKAIESARSSEIAIRQKYIGTAVGCGWPSAPMEVTYNPTFQAVVMIKPCCVSETTALAHKVRGVLFRRYPRLWKVIGRVEPASLVGFASSRYDLLATPLVHRNLLPSSSRGLRVCIRSGPHSSIERTHSIIFWCTSIQSSDTARKKLQPPIALGLGPCRFCSRLSHSHLLHREGA
jgi:hypothetical protein